MKKIIDYKILTDSTIMRPEEWPDYYKDFAKIRQGLAEQVIQAINEGYQPLGGIAITSKAPECTVFLAQAVVKYEE